MAFEKIITVCIFLGVLLVVQLFLYKKYRVSSFKDISVKNLKIISKLSLSKNSELFVILAGGESFLITVTKNCSPTVTSLSLEVPNGIKQEPACD
jgi:flagellar biogenesis protein FliO